MYEAIDPVPLSRDMSLWCFPLRLTQSLVLLENCIEIGPYLLPELLRGQKVIAKSTSPDNVRSRLTFFLNGGAVWCSTLTLR